MTGGQAFVFDPTATVLRKVNPELVTVMAANPDQLEIVRAFIETHLEHTGSAKASEILDDWDVQSRHFFAVVPKTDVAKLEAKQQGIGGKDESDDELVAADEGR